MRVEYHPLTLSELNNVVVYYNQQRAGSVMSFGPTWSPGGMA